MYIYKECIDLTYDEEPHVVLALIIGKRPRGTRIT
jgi:hypothetical protein